MNKTHSVGSLYSAAHALCESSEFVGCGVLPSFSKFGMMEQLMVFQGGSSVGVKDCIGEIEAQMLEGEGGFEEDFVLRFDCCQVVGFKIVNVFDEGLLSVWFLLWTR